MGHQPLLVFPPANVVAQRVKVKRYAFELEVLEQLPHQVDDLDVLGWLAHPERFRARLEELPITTRLHPLVAKHRAKVGTARCPRPSESGSPRTRTGEKHRGRRLPRVARRRCPAEGCRSCL